MRYRVHEFLEVTLHDQERLTFGVGVTRSNIHKTFYDRDAAIDYCDQLNIDQSYGVIHLNEPRYANELVRWVEEPVSVY